MNNNVFQVKKDQSGSPVKVVSYNLLDHHHILARISYIDFSHLNTSIKGVFSLNTTLLNDEDVMDAIYFIQKFKK